MHGLGDNSSHGPMALWTTLAMAYGILQTTIAMAYGILQTTMAMVQRLGVALLDLK